MRLLRLLSLPLALCLFVLPLRAQTASSHEDAAIIAVLQKSAADWNRGDLDSFATSYKNSPDILFIGRTVRRGYAQMLEAYRTGYSTREKMGTLTFSNLEVQPLDDHFATATGHFHLERSAAVGNSNGYFMVVMEKTPVGWKIVRDDSTSTDAAPSK
jgi:ketosteroid isomerase-like protein